MKKSVKSLALLPFLLAALALAESCATQQKPSSQTKEVVAVQNVSRYSEYPLSEFQTRVMNEATKVSSACRMYRDLYGRWPNSILELQSRTEGIDYSIFMGNASITPLADDTATIRIFDGIDYRETTAVPGSFSFSPEERSEASKPDFKIKIQ